MKRLLALICLLPTLVHAENLYPFTENGDAERFNRLSQEVRCVVCQNQNIADSTAPLAKDLRQKIYTMVLEKQSNQQIKQFLVERYGAFILFEPPFSKLTLLLWFFPILGCITILIFLIRLTTSKSS